MRWLFSKAITTNARIILLALHPNIRARFLAAVVAFIIATKFTKTDFRIFDGLEHFSPEQIAWEKVTTGRGAPFGDEKFVDDAIINQSMVSNTIS